MNTTLPLKKRILVIDDNAGILFALRQALEVQGHEVHTAECFAGVASVDALAPDLIYLDISLVGQDGREISRELKSDARTKNIPIIILTAYPNAGGLTKEAGADDHLPKPFELTHLWEMTARYAA
jgi:CheY-like chemotaxis protein